MDNTSAPERRASISEEKAADEPIQHLAALPKDSSSHDSAPTPIVHKELSIESQDEALKDRYENIDDGLDPALIRRARRKADLRIALYLGLLYSISLVDRNALGIAYLAHMKEDLGLGVDPRFSVCVLAFFVTYTLAELPANLGIRKFGASRWLSTAGVLWGITQLCIGFAPTWGVLAFLRAVLGVFEAVVFPGAIYLLATWNVRGEVQTRISIFALCGLLIGAVSVVMSYGFAKMDGLGGLRGWSWIFIMYGIITIIFASAGYFVIVDFPDSPRASKFFTPEEREVIKLRIQRDRADAVYDGLTPRKLLQCAKNPVFLAYAFLLGSNTMISTVLAYFTPILLTSFGFTTTQAQLLGFPPCIAAAIYVVAQAMASDRLRLRSPFFLSNILLNILGCLLIALLTNRGARLFALYMLLCTATSNAAFVIGWLHSNIGGPSGQSQRAFATAMVTTAIGVGGIVASVSFRAVDAPAYRPGILISVGSQVLSLLVALSLVAYFWRMNRRAAQGKTLIYDTPGFRYML